MQFPKGGRIQLRWWGNEVFMNSASFCHVCYRQHLTPLVRHSCGLRESTITRDRPNNRIRITHASSSHSPLPCFVVSVRNWKDFASRHSSFASSRIIRSSQGVPSAATIVRHTDSHLILSRGALTHPLSLNVCAAAALASYSPSVPIYIPISLSSLGVTSYS